MVFEPKKLYKHDRALDMMIFVVEVLDQKSEQVDLSVLYTNGKWLFWPDPEKITIKSEHLQYWKRVPHTLTECYA
jgi:hypothetical protein